MIRKITLLFLLFTCASSIHAQQLSNTYWKAYDLSGNFSLYWRFAGGIVGFSADNTIYESVSPYSENGNTFSIHDLDTNNCPLADTGHYTFSIQNDTMVFTLIGDNCSDRMQYLVGSYFVNLHTGIGELDAAAFHVYPNPFDEGLHFSGGTGGGELSICNAAGSVLIKENFTGDFSLETKMLKPGIYFYELKTKSESTLRGKLLKQ